MGVFSLRKICNAIDRFCLYHPRFGIPHLMRYVVFITAAVYFLDMFSQSYASYMLYFNANLILQGELWRKLSRRLGRLRDDAQLLREYCLQVRELFQTEVDVRQNRIMKTLTVVTTLFLPLSLVAGWYGMNFAGMPELGWKYGYPAVIVVSVLIVILSLWIMKKKKFW